VPYHVVAADGRVLPLAFTRIEDAYVYALVTGKSDAAAVARWALIDRGSDGVELVLPGGELWARACQWREHCRL
jgi:hypothetical protein